MIDAHHHLWSAAAVRELPWVSGRFGALRRRYDVGDLTPLLPGAGVDRTVAVEALGGTAESLRLLGAAAEAGGLIAGVVGWVDLSGPDVASAIERLRNSRGGRWLVGVRHSVTEAGDARVLETDVISPGAAVLERSGLALDLLVRPEDLAGVRTLARAHPGLTLVVNHLGKPPLQAGGLAEWSQGMSSLRGEANVYVKVSGLVTVSDWSAWQPADFREVTGRALDWFTPRRLLLGSDWPVCLVAGSYRDVFHAYAGQFGDLSGDERSDVLGGTAARVYRLGRC